MKIICWWSGGITSAVACKKAIEIYGLDACRMVFIDTKNEDDDTYRFKLDCERWYEKEIETITEIGDKYESIEDVWDKYQSLNVAKGAICSTELKRNARLKWQKSVDFDYQVFGYEHTKREFSRALSMTLNWPQAKPIYPLLMFGLDKNACFQIVAGAGIKKPRAYELGLNNNNCLKTGCVQGGIGYWQKMRDINPGAFHEMAMREHRFTNNEGKPKTILKDQSKKAKESGNERVFLVKHADYPNLKCLDDFIPAKISGLTECNGFCGTNDLIEDEKEVQVDIKFNYEAAK